MNTKMLIGIQKKTEVTENTALVKDIKTNPILPGRTVKTVVEMKARGGYNGEHVVEKNIYG